MNMHQLVKKLDSHPVKQVMTYGVLCEDEAILAFGYTERNGDKVRQGSVTWDEDGECFIVLQFPTSEHEYRAKGPVELGWFLWMLDNNKYDWAKAEEIMRCQ